MGDVGGNFGSSRKSATNSVIGTQVKTFLSCLTNALVACVDGKIAPIFFSAQKMNVPIEVDVTNLNMGDVVDIFPYEQNR